MSIVINRLGPNEERIRPASIDASDVIACSPKRRLTETIMSSLSPKAIPLLPTWNMGAASRLRALDGTQK